MKICIVVTFLITSLLLSFQTNGKTSAKEVTFNQTESRWFMQIGIQNGGDSTEPLPIYNRADGQLYLYSNSITVFAPWTGTAQNTYVEDKANAGGFWKFEFGRENAISERFSISTSFGYQTDYIQGDLTDGTGGKGNFGMTRFTFDTIGFYNAGQHRFGLGAAYHLTPKFTHKEYGSGFRLRTTYDFDNALGAIFQYDYLVNEDVSVGFRVTKIAYDLAKVTVRYHAGSLVDDFDVSCGDECKDIINADSFGIHMTMRF